MKNFRGRITRTEDNDYLIEDSDSDDSEVGFNLFDDDFLEVLIEQQTRRAIADLIVPVANTLNLDDNEEEEEASSSDLISGTDDLDDDSDDFVADSDSNLSYDSIDIDSNAQTLALTRINLQFESLQSVVLNYRQLIPSPVIRITDAAAASLFSGEAGLEHILRNRVAQMNQVSEVVDAEIESVVENVDSSIPPQHVDNAETEGGNETGEKVLLQSNVESDGDPGDSADHTYSTLRRMSPPGDNDEATCAEATCNPMVEEDDEGEDNALRGDRIGSTTYSERHVLKILMTWVQELPKYSYTSLVNSNASDPSISSPSNKIDRTRFLEQDLEEEMALLWDMSLEPDVITFLLNQQLLSIISHTINSCNCQRLIEVSLGILANVLSQKNVLEEEFRKEEENLEIIASVMDLLQKFPNAVFILIQVFAVLRRVTWSLRHVAMIDKWKSALTSNEFLSAINFILTSSMNVLLIGNVLGTMHFLLEALSPEQSKIKANQEHNHDEGEENEVHEPYDPFCAPSFVPAVVEGLKELMNEAKPKKVEGRHSDSERQSQSSATEDFVDMEITIPEEHIASAILSGFSSLFHLRQCANGRNAIAMWPECVIGVLTTFLDKFLPLTDSEEDESRLDYFSLSCSLLSFCQTKMDKPPSPESLQALLQAYKKLLEVLDPSSQLPSFVIHAYFESLDDHFGAEKVSEFKKSLAVENKTLLERCESLVLQASRTN